MQLPLAKQYLAIYDKIVDTQQKRILLVEDEPSLLRLLTDTFSEHALTTLTAKDGEEGLMMALQQHPDLIILDMLMPKMDGMTVLKKLREDAWGKTVPVIFLTNVNADSNAILDTIIKHQPAFYFVKSNIELKTLVEKIKELLV